MDAGTRLVNYLYSRMKIDDEWAVRRERGFTWWAGDLAQRVWAEEPVEDNGVEICRVHCQTDYLAGFDGGAEVRAAIALLGACSTVSGPVIGEGRVRLCSSIWVHDQTLALWEGFFAGVALVQVAAAHTTAQGFAGLVAGTWPAASEHPMSGRREVEDDMVGFNHYVAVPAGAQPSRFIGDEFESAERQWGRRISVLTSASPTGLTSEFRFRDSTALLQMFGDVSNPTLGNGLFMTLNFPIHFAEEHLPSLALAMNVLEEQEFTRTPFIGSWCPNHQLPGTLSYVSFLPNCLYQPSIITNFLPYARARTDWADDALSRAATIAKAHTEGVVVPSLLSMFLDDDRSG